MVAMMERNNNDNDGDQHHQQPEEELRNHSANSSSSEVRGPTHQGAHHEEEMRDIARRGQNSDFNSMSTVRTSCSSSSFFAQASSPTMPDGYGWKSDDTSSLQRRQPRTTRSFPMPDLYGLLSGNGRSFSEPNTRNALAREQHASLFRLSILDRATPNTNIFSGASPNAETMNLLWKIEKQIEKKTPRLKKQEFELDVNLPFPAKLHYILSNPSYQHLISWLPHGRAWRVRKPKEFEEQVIPKFFRSAKFASFMRQVNGWAFTRITQGPDTNGYYHEMFLRGLPALCFKMKRPPKVKNAASDARNAAGASSGIPDFYLIEKVASLPAMTPFKPTIQQVKKNVDGEEVVEREYLIEPLPKATITVKSVEEDRISTDNALEEDEDDASDSAEWDTEDGLEVPSSFLDPFDSSLDLVEQGKDEEEQASEDAAESLNLSQAEIMYLSHQNETLLLHGGQQSEHNTS